ncbi:MAG TPA: PhzF family phenazine biosynthesis protein [Gaiellaceae bacterium]
MGRFRQVDVFGDGPYTGNPVAVVLDADGLTTDDMERFTRWTNLSEATFVLPPSSPAADYRVRIFTSAAATPDRPSAELSFAGHPTLGTCHAWLEAGGVPRDTGTVVQECGAGLVRIRRGGDVGLAFAAPPLLRYEPPTAEIVDEIAASLRIARAEIVAASWLDNGPGWVCALLRSGDAVRALEPSNVRLDLGVCAVDGDDVTVRAFFPRGGSTAEDPVTGSLNAGVAQWLADTRRVTFPYVASQTSGRVHVARDDDGTFWIGGATVTCISGEVLLNEPSRAAAAARSSS